jgi:hypothetical protein
MRSAVVLFLVGAAALGACVQVSSERIAARDLFEAAPMLAGLAPETIIGYAPLPGAQRVIKGRELEVIARQHGLETGPVPDVCVERAVRVIGLDDLRAAMLAALEMPLADLEIVESSNLRLPEGRLEFQRSALNQPPADTPESPVIWRGRLVYDGRHTAAVWAKVRIRVDRKVVVATENIPAGTSIQAQQINGIQVREFPYPSHWIDSKDEIVGKVAR